MTVNELIELLSTQPGDYEVAVRTIDNDNFSIWDDAITGLAEVEDPSDGMPGYVILDYEGTKGGNPPTMTTDRRWRNINANPGITRTITSWSRDQVDVNGPGSNFNPGLYHYPFAML